MATHARSCKTQGLSRETLRFWPLLLWKTERPVGQPRSPGARRAPSGPPVSGAAGGGGAPAGTPAPPRPRPPLGARGATCWRSRGPSRRSIINPPRSRLQETRARGARRARPDGGGRRGAGSGRPGADSGRRAPWTQVRAAGGPGAAAGGGPDSCSRGAPAWPWNPTSRTRDARRMLWKVLAT